LLREFRQNQSLMCDVVGFIDDDPLMAHSILQGKPVLGTGETLAENGARHAVKRVLVAVPSATGPQMVRILKLALDARSGVQDGAGFGDLIQGAELGKQIRMSLSKTYSVEGRSIWTRTAFWSASREKSLW